MNHRICVAIVAALLVLALLVLALSAFAQDVSDPQADAIAKAIADELVGHLSGSFLGQILTALSTPGAAYIVLRGLRANPVMVGAADAQVATSLTQIGDGVKELAADQKAQGETLARVDERLGAVEREQRYARKQLHRHGNALAVIAGERGVRLPDDDSDEPR